MEKTSERFLLLITLQQMVLHQSKADWSLEMRKGYLLAIKNIYACVINKDKVQSVCLN